MIEHDVLTPLEAAWLPMVRNSQISKHPGRGAWASAKARGVLANDHGDDGRHEGIVSRRTTLRARHSAAVVFVSTGTLDVESSRRCDPLAYIAWEAGRLSYR